MEIIDLGSAVTREDIAHLRDLLSGVKPGEEVRIILEAADAHEANDLFALLRREGFDYQPKGSGNGRRYYVTARRLPPR
ncbi:hypothetical protein [Thermodesulfitimonas autotrophica]|uniref:hypothetical protein n=1 Tax=Thermodesulfitimonas autotrophica TaxID=1894989 RepID=UPI002FE3EE2B